MKPLITILIILIVVMGGWKIYDYWVTVESEKEEKARLNQPKEVRPDELPGLPYEMIQSLRDAQQKGAGGMKDWLEKNRRKTQDPRLAWIELDYVVMIASKNPVEAKRIFTEVKTRIATNSPIYYRIRELQKTYE